MSSLAHPQLRWPEPTKPPPDLLRPRADSAMTRGSQASTLRPAARPALHPCTTRRRDPHAPASRPGRAADGPEVPHGAQRQRLGQAPGLRQRHEVMGLDRQTRAAAAVRKDRLAPAAGHLQASRPGAAVGRAGVDAPVGLASLTLRLEQAGVVRTTRSAARSAADDAGTQDAHASVQSRSSSTTTRR
jgi:hypothetical protein